jgi:SAM-dependent methyltransferase
VSATAHEQPRVLHFAPELAIRRVLDEIGVGSYLSVDLEPGRADLAADITDLPLEDRAFDLVICSHVLEHVADDGAALRELARVTAPNGEALLLTPVSYGLEATVEDPSATPEERLRRFGQDDHVRVYGRDFADRLTGAGLEADRFDPDSLPTRQRDLWGLRTEFPYALRNEIYVARPTRRSAARATAPDAPRAPAE